MFISWWRGASWCWAGWKFRTTRGWTGIRMPMPCCTRLWMRFWGHWERDIGTFFPNTDPRWKDAPSTLFLREAGKQVEFAEGRIVNIDATLIAQEPKIGPHIQLMKETIAEALNMNIKRIGIKATTNELMGFIGRGEGIAAMAVASVQLPDNHGQS